MASKSFIRGLLDDPEDPQLPQYNPQGGWDTAANFGRMAAGMTTPGAVADAAGYLGGPSVAENVRGGNYGDAALQALGLIPGVGLLGKVAGGAKMAMFLGPTAKLADKVKLGIAEKMASDGASREAIWDATGWFKGVDDKWRFEIPDDKASLKGYIQPGSLYDGKLPEVINHEQIFKAYPDTRDIDVNYGQRGVSSGAYAPPLDGIHGLDESIRIGAKSDNPLSTGLHEIQHAIQDREGFAAGGNNFILRAGTPAWDIYQERLKAIKTPLNRETYSLAAGYEGLAPEKDYKAYLKMVNKPSDLVLREAQKYAADTAYMKSAGEVEARTTQKRMNLSADERNARYPWLDYDIPEDQQIVRFRGLLSQ